MNEVEPATWIDALAGAMVDNFAILTIAGVFVVLIVAQSLRSVIEVRTREQTRREIAAYIAEGSMTPEHGERLMKAGHRLPPGV